MFQISSNRQHAARTELTPIRFAVLFTNLIILVLLSYSEDSWALRRDRDQPINIKADRVEINEKTEISHYQGRVHLQQGTLNILADTVIVHLKAGKLTKIIIDGKPATFEQQPEDNKDIVKSKAQHMEYYAAKQRLILKNNAQVIQGANNFSGDFIEYDTLNSTVKANKNEDSDSRVHAIIQPKSDKTPITNGAAPQKNNSLELPKDRPDDAKTTTDTDQPKVNTAPLKPWINER